MIYHRKYQDNDDEKKRKKKEKKEWKIIKVMIEASTGVKIIRFI